MNLFNIPAIIFRFQLRSLTILNALKNPVCSEAFSPANVQPAIQKSFQGHWQSFF